MRVRSLAVVLTATSMALLSACGGSPTTPVAGSGADAAASPMTSSSGPAPASVTLLAHDSFVVSDALKADFEKSTGMRLDVVTAGDAGTMVAGAILAAGSPSADVMFGVDNTLISRAATAGVFAPYSSPDASALAAPFNADTAGGTVTAVDYGDVCVNVDDRYLADAGLARPATLDDLLKPEYRDLLVVEDPGVSSPGLAFLLATIARYGDGWQDYWKALAANGVKVASSWTDAYMGDFTAGGGKGDRPLVVSYATSPPAEIVYASDPKPTTPSTSVMTDGCYRQVEYAGVLAGAANPVGAQKVIDWLISEPVQADVPLSMFVFPARSGVVLPDVFTKFAAVVAEPLQLDPKVVSDGLAGWLADWGTVMGR
jgi:thiamine transport system substrate-binding protein